MRVVLIAISWGAKLGAWLAFNDFPWLERCIFITPGWFPLVDMGFADKYLVAKNLFYNQGDGLVPVPIPGSDYFTKSSNWQRFIDNDTDTLRTCTARFFYESRKLDATWKSKKNFCVKPSLLLLASDDRIISNRVTGQFFSARFTNPASCNMEYAGCEHTLEFDQPDLKFVDDILNWLR
jgi:pimeloyl-ACP methyl ester carboxylesterase